MKIRERNHGNKGMTRGDLAGTTGCHIETIRYYEKIGLMPKPKRAANGYRFYDEGDERRLGFIMRGRELGFNIDGLRGLLTLVDGGDYTCGEIKEMTVGHLNEVRNKVSDLKKIERVLSKMADQCEGGRVPECPVIDAMFERG